MMDMTERWVPGVFEELDMGGRGEEMRGEKGNSCELCPCVTANAMRAENEVEMCEDVFAKPDTPSVTSILKTPYLTRTEQLVLKQLYKISRKVAQEEPTVSAYLAIPSSTPIHTQDSPTTSAQKLQHAVKDIALLNASEQLALERELGYSSSKKAPDVFDQLQVLDATTFHETDSGKNGFSRAEPTNRENASDKDTSEVSSPKQETDTASSDTELSSVNKVALPMAIPMCRRRPVSFKELCGEVIVVSGGGASLCSFLQAGMFYVIFKSQEVTWVENCLVLSLVTLANYAECCGAMRSCVLRHENLLYDLILPIDWWRVESHHLLEVSRIEMVEGCLTVLLRLARHTPVFSKLRGLGLLPRLLSLDQSPHRSVRLVSTLLVSALLTEEEARGVELTEPQLTSLVAPLPMSVFSMNHWFPSMLEAVHKFSFNAQNREWFLVHAIGSHGLDNSDLLHA